MKRERLRRWKERLMSSFSEDAPVRGHNQSQTRDRLREAIAARPNRIKIGLKLQIYLFPILVKNSLILIQYLQRFPGFLKHFFFAWIPGNSYTFGTIFPKMKYELQIHLTFSLLEKFDMLSTVLKSPLTELPGEMFTRYFCTEPGFCKVTIISKK